MLPKSLKRVRAPVVGFARNSAPNEFVPALKSSTRIWPEASTATLAGSTPWLLPEPKSLNTVRAPVVGFTRNSPP